MPQKLTKTQKFRKSQLALKNKSWSLARFLKLSFTSTVCNVTICCALDSPGLRQSFESKKNMGIKFFLFKKGNKKTCAEYFANLTKQKNFGITF